ncbi:MAG TPA: arsinothricin resistance N-acetyltransferase ArsN1 family B [Gemmataceae bacterium]|jgi:phosphinothricin acetyltransferase
MSFVFRLATPADAEQVLAIYGPYCSTPISFELEPPTVEEMRRRMAKILGYYPWLLCEEGGEVLGYVYACSHRERAAYRWSVDTAVYIHPQRRGRGIGRALYTSLFKMLPLQGYINAYAGVTLPNPASVRLHESMGFQRVGVYRQVGYKCEAWHDVAWYEMLLQPRPSQPQPPKSVQEIQDEAEWRSALCSGLSLLRP